jgi:hypothetical protein
MLIAIAVLAIAVGAVSRARSGWWYYAAGWWSAERELWQGTATVYELGGLLCGDVCNMDEDTGLPIYRVCACVIGKGDFERVQGHNHHIEEYIRLHGLPGNTLKPWKEVLFDLKRWFDGRSSTDVPKWLIAGGQALISPDGRNSVRPIGDVNDHGILNDSLTIVIASGDVVLSDWHARFGPGVTDLLWRPEGSRFVAIRSVAEKVEHYQAYDLRTGSFLLEENWSEGKKVSGSAPFALPIKKPGQSDPYDDLAIGVDGITSMPPTSDP